MKYSVVIPFYNNGPEVFNAISSVANQTLPPCLIVIVNDCSSPLSSKMLIGGLANRFIGLVDIITHQVNQGVSNSRNTGINASLSAGVDFIAFCDADDQWAVNKMEFQIPLFCHPSIMAVACCLIDSPNCTGILENTVTSLRTLDLLLRNYIQPSTLVVRSESFLAAGLFPFGRRFAEEGDFYNRLAEKGSILLLRLGLVEYDTRDYSNHANPAKSNRVRLSSNVLAMYLGNIENILNCRKRGSLSSLSTVLFVLFQILRFLRRILLNWFGRLLPS
ncbi:glycosyltransferase family 2 protein [Cyanobium sp. ATX 6F1]|uniref:glycosyltransferase family 2 protein n=1 Tax=unclassified Cyanobium TaxID=2627006 RepID=UPI0020CF7401|nr:glycosyltransferase family A protein [Cyanobium sp. ATX 6F1]MCP9916642.1 glycosyltransferase family 2 protein [Cyanobium sp. ATX 6F1]